MRAKYRAFRTVNRSDNRNMLEFSASPSTIYGARNAMLASREDLPERHPNLSLVGGGAHRLNPEIECHYLGIFYGAAMVQAVASIQVPDESQLTVTMTMSIADWSLMRDDIQGLLQQSVPLAQMALQLNSIIERARAQVGA